MSTYTQNDLRKRYENLTHLVTAECKLTTELVGGQSADKDGLEAFVKHHLKLEGEEAQQAIERIMKEEISEKDVPSENGELQEKLTYGVCVIRRDVAGPWIGDWMVKANLKAAASRLGLFASKRGTKGDVAEMGNVRAVDVSLLTPERPERIHLVDATGKPVETYFQEFKGRVNTPSGSVSIVSHRECVAPEARFAFEFRCYAGKLTEDDLANIFASSQIIGLGSAKAFERGKFVISKLEIETLH